MLRNPCEAKYQFSNKKSDNVWTRHFNDSKAFTEYSNDMNDIYKNIEENNPNKKRKKKFKKNCSKKVNPVVTELFIRDKKLNIFFVVFITQSYCAIIMVQKILDKILHKMFL